jgi:flagellar basal-body rod modification protein FlgD
MTTPIASTVAQATPVVATPGTTSTTDNTKLSSQTFLQLLVAQLQYQDPSKPVDTASFMNETATLTQVQTMEANAKATSDMLSTQQAQTAASLVGKTVSYTDLAGKTSTGVVTAATISTSPPTLRVGSSDVGLSQIQQVLSTGA